MDFVLGVAFFVSPLKLPKPVRYNLIKYSIVSLCGTLYQDLDRFQVSNLVFEILQSVETNDVEYPYDTPRNQRKFSDFDDVRGEEDFDRLPEKRTKLDELEG